MRLDLTFRNLDATDELRERAMQKFEKASKHLREPIEGTLVLRVEKHRNEAELVVHAAGEQYFRVREETSDMAAAVDGVMKKLERVVRRHKERIIDRTHTGPGLPVDGFGAA